MTEEEAITAICQQWKDGWEALHPRDADTYQNVADDPLYVPWTLQDEIYDVADLGALGVWARVTIQHTTREQTTQGRPSQDECTGNVFVQLFGPQNEGVGKLVRLAEHVRAAIAKKDLNGLQLYSGRSQEMPTDGKWALRMVVVPFRYTQLS